MLRALGIRHSSLRTAFELHGSYAQRNPKGAAQFSVKIFIADIPGPPGEFNQFIDVVPPKHHHGKPPDDNNGHDLKIYTCPT
jgi:hypothetical protein